MRRALARLNAGWKARGIHELQVGFGVNHGDAIVGNLGCEAKMEVSVIGDAVKGGLYGEYPSLEAGKLMEGDLHYNNDFRGTYATLLERWMGLDSRPIVGGSFEQLDFL